MAVWTSAPMTACDVVCDRSGQRIVEVALVPLHQGAPDPSRVRTLHDAVPPQAPHPGTALPEEGFVAGHNLARVWPLLQGHLTMPLAVIDTALMTRELGIRRANSIGALVHRYGFRHRLAALVPDSRPRQPLWNAMAVGLVLGRMASEVWGRPPTVWELWQRAGFTPGPARPDYLTPDQASSGFRAAPTSRPQRVSPEQINAGEPRR